MDCETKRKNKNSCDAVVRLHRPEMAEPHAAYILHSFLTLILVLCSFCFLTFSPLVRHVYIEAHPKVEQRHRLFLVA
jgi:hypothetical protein